MTKAATTLKLITTIYILLILLRLVFHYTEMGFFEFLFFDLIPKWWLLLIPTIFFLIKFVDKKLTYSVIFEFIIAGASIYIIYFVFTPDKLDNLDWKINYKKRQEIIKLAKEKKLDNIIGNNYKLPLSLTLFPYIKSNTVNIQNQVDTMVTVTFYTDRGINDHYAAFIYSNDPTQIDLLNDKVKRGGNDYKKEDNWYFIHD